MWTVMLCTASGQTIPRDLKNWTLEYEVGGAIRPRGLTLELANEGRLTVANIAGSTLTTQASGEVMENVRKFLETAHTTKPRVPGPDEPYATLVLTSGGARYELNPKGLDALLFSTAQKVLQKALLGTWWESEWQLCQPTAQLTADQVDVPIESLVFTDDGQFSVTWRGGGARVYGEPSSKIPHTSMPDYSGRYVISPDYGDLRVTFEHGIQQPRDFAGDGSFQIKGDKLVLRHIWFGTFSARTKPDICALTFTRTAVDGAASKLPTRELTRHGQIVGSVVPVVK